MTKNISMKAVILAIPFLQMSATAISPALADIMADYPHISANMVTWMVTLPSFTSVIAALILSRLVTFMTKRSLLMIALGSFLIGGIVPYFIDNFYLILVFRAVFGTSIGFLMSLSPGLVTDFFDGEERAAMMGNQSAAVNLGGLVFMFFGGILAAVHWNVTFLVYLIGLPIALWIFLKLPEQVNFEQEHKEKINLPVKVYILLGGVMLFNTLFFSLMTNASVMISAEKLGDTTQAGEVLTFFTVGSFLAGMFFGKTYKTFSSYTTAFGWLCAGTGMLIAGLSHNLILIIIGSFLTGAGMATTMPSYLIKLSHSAPPNAVSIAFAYTAVAAGIGQFLSPYFLGIFNLIFSREIGRFPILVSSIILLMMAIAIFISTRVSRNNMAELSQ